MSIIKDYILDSVVFDVALETFKNKVKYTLKCDSFIIYNDLSLFYSNLEFDITLLSIELTAQLLMNILISIPVQSSSPVLCADLPLVHVTCPLNFPLWG